MSPTWATHMYLYMLYGNVLKKVHDIS